MLEVTDLIYILDYGFACYRDIGGGQARYLAITPAYFDGTKVRHTEKFLP